MNCLIQRMFENRGYTPEFIRAINDSSYDNLKDIDTLAVRLKEIHDEHIPVTILPDFDMDGIVAGTLGFAGLSELGFSVALYTPVPSEGYGFTPDTIDDLLLRFPATKVIITCDVGIGCFEAIEYCKKKGIEIIITDHHKQERVADTDIIVNPMRLDETYAHPGICGAFVLYQVLQYYADLYCNYFQQDQIRRLRVFAGIGTISDSMPLLYENRKLVRDSIMISRLVYGDGTDAFINNLQGCVQYRQSFSGLYQMLKLYEEYGVINNAESIDEDFYGYYLAPTFNSAKRMDGDMNKTFGVFFAGDPASQMENAKYLYQLNVERKNLVEREFMSMMDNDQPYAPYIYFSTARPGILGLLAMKAMKESGVPTFVIVDSGEPGETRYHGSGRSPEWFPCWTHLHNDIFIAGHEFAFGCGMSTLTEVQRLFRILNVDVPKAMSEVVIEEFKPDFVISTDWSADTGIDIELFEDYIVECDKYRPFGKGFPAPVAVLKFNNRDVIEWKRIGKTKQHLKISFANGFDVLCWNQAALISQKDSFDDHVVIGKLGTSEYDGVTSVNFIGDLQEQ